MTDPLKELISQAEQIIKENNKVYQFTKVSQSQTAFAISARNAAGDVATFLSVRGPYDEFSWERAFYANGWTDVVVTPSPLDGPLTIAAVPNAAIAPGDTPFSERASSGTATSLSLQPFRSFPAFSVPGIGVRRFSPAPHVPTTPYGISSSDNDIQMYFMSLSNDEKFKIRWEGGNFITWWNERASKAAASTSSSSYPRTSTSPEVVSAFKQKIPNKRTPGYDEFLKLMRKVKSGTGATALEILPDDVLIDEYESRTGNNVQTLYALGKERIMKFRDYDSSIMMTALDNLRSALRVEEDYERDQRAEDAIDEDARARNERFKNRVNEVTGLLGGFLGSLRGSDSNSRGGDKYRP